MSFGTILTYTADGSSNTFAVSFPYIDAGDITVILNGTTITGWTQPSAGSITLPYSASTLSGSTVVIARETQATIEDVTFQVGPLDPNDANIALLQLLYLYQESQDRLDNYLGGGSLYNTVITVDLATLPTTLPSTPATLWNNGGSLCITPGTPDSTPVMLTLNIAALPASLPEIPGVLWNDGGALSIS